MPAKTQASKPKRIPSPEMSPEADPADLVPTPLLPEDELDSIPDEELLDTPPYEDPEPGEGP